MQAGAVHGQTTHPNILPVKKGIRVKAPALVQDPQHKPDGQVDVVLHVLEKVAGSKWVVAM
jgi:hypothetical protein